MFRFFTNLGVMDWHETSLNLSPPAAAARLGLANGEALLFKAHRHCLSTSLLPPLLSSISAPLQMASLTHSSPLVYSKQVRAGWFYLLWPFFIRDKSALIQRYAASPILSLFWPPNSTPPRWGARFVCTVCVCVRALTLDYQVCEAFLMCGWRREKREES